MVVLVEAVEEAPPPAEDGVVAAAGVLDLVDEEGVAVATDGDDLGDEEGVVAATDGDDLDVLLGVAAGVVEDFLVLDEGVFPAAERQPWS